MNEIQINSKELLRAVSAVGTIIKQRNTIPVLDNILFEASNDISITADNLEIRSSIEIRYDYEVQIKACLNYSLLSSILKSLPSEPINITFEEKEAVIKSTTGVYKLPIVETAEFPKRAVIENGGKATINALDFGRVLKTASKFTSNIELCSTQNVHISIGQQLIVQSTDKITLYQGAVKGSGNEKKILINPEVARHIASVCTEDREIELRYDDKNLTIELEDKTITAVQSWGNYPIEGFDRVFTRLDNGVGRLSIDKEQLETALKRVSPVSDYNYHHLVKLHLKDNTLEISIDNKSYAFQAKETHECKFEGEQEAGYNCKFLSNLISVFDDEVNMEIKKDNIFYLHSQNTKALLSPVAL